MASRGGAPVIIVHHIAHVRAALRAARAEGRAVVLQSAPGAAAYAGVGFWKALMTEAEEEFPGVRFAGVLDCGDDPGLVMAALRSGLARIAFRGAGRVRARLDSLAARSGARLVAPAPGARALDLLDQADPEAAAVRHLAPRRRRRAGP